MSRINVDELECEIHEFIGDENEKDKVADVDLVMSYIENNMDNSSLPFDLQKVYKKITPSFFFVSKEGEFTKQYPGSWTKSDFLEILKENKIK